jgi:hypothetical protein
VEIKCQLDETDEFLLQILLLAQQVSGTIMPIIRSSRVLNKWLLPVVFGAWFSSCRYRVELRVVFPVCGLQPANRTHNPQILEALNNTFKPTVVHKFSTVKYTMHWFFPFFNMEAKFGPLEKWIKNE